MTLDTRRYRYHYHFKLNDPTALREKYRLDPYNARKQDQFISYLDTPNYAFLNKGIEVCRIAADTEKESGVFITQTNRYTTWLTQQSLLLGMEKRNAQGQVQQNYANPDFAQWLDMFRTQDATTYAWRMQDDRFVRIGQTTKQQNYQSDYVLHRHPETFEKFFINMSLVESSLTPDEQPIITFNSPQMNDYTTQPSLLTMQDKTGRAEELERAEQSNHQALLSFIDCLHFDNVITAVTVPASVQVLRRLAPYVPKLR